MARFSQEGRPIRVDTPLGEDVLLLQRLQGEEGVSDLYHYSLELISERDDVAPADLLRKPVAVTVALSEGERKIHGLIRRFTQRDQRDDLTSYSAEVVPWLWFLTLSQDCKIFQNKSVLDIVKEVFDGLGYSDYDIRCSNSYQPREYCVQYRETHFNFVSRLLEEEGIFYFFEHSNDKHVLVIADMNNTFQPCPGQDAARMATDEGPWQGEDVVTGLTLESAVHLGKVTLRDYDFTRPTLNLETSASGEEGEEVYAYPGEYVDLGEGERYAQLLLEEGECGGQVIRGQGNCRAFQSGFKFTLQEHYRADANREYLLLQVSHHAEAGDYRSWETAPLDYGNTFVCIPADTPYRPPRRSRKPRIRGSQTALVVGKSGEEVFTDEYGRVKVQFYWDRLGKNDQNSSCWVRVASPWAGKGYGGVSIPRIGNEVVVDFLEGDPDRPLITGSVYNAVQNVPFSLPGSDIQMGMKSRSSPGGGGYNEITMTDTKGKEEITIHAQHDMGTTVEHDDTQTVKNDRGITVVGKHTETIQKDCKITILGKSTMEITKDTSLKILAGNHTVTVSRGTQSTTAKSDVTVKSDTKIKHAVGGQSVSIDTSQIELKAGGSTVTIDSGQIVLSAGGSKVTIDSKGVVAQGTKVELDGGGKVTVDPSGVVATGTQIKLN